MIFTSFSWLKDRKALNKPLTLVYSCSYFDKLREDFQIFKNSAYDIRFVCGLFKKSNLVMTLTEILIQNIGNYKESIILI